MSSKPRLLLVDDEPDIGYVLSRGLRQKGFEVDFYLDPVNALANYRTDYFDGIVLDIRMPKMSGFELARKIWEKDPKAKICFLSAYELYSKEVLVVFPKLQPCFLMKPMTISDLILRLNNHGISPISKKAGGV